MTTRPSILCCTTASVLLLLLLLGSAHLSASQRETSPPDFAKLADKDPFHRIRALINIGVNDAAGPKPAAALATFMLTEDDSDVRLVAASVLASMRDYAKDSVPQMIRLLKDDAANADRRARAAQVLGAISMAAPESMSPLIDALENTKEPPILRRSAANALINFGHMPADKVAAIEQVAFAPRETPQLRMLAMRALANTGRDAVSAIPKLSSVLEDDGANLDLREGAAYSLGAICSDAQVGYPVKVLTQVLGTGGGKLDLRVDVADALRSMGPMAGEALPTLRSLAMTRDEPPKLRLSALDAMARIGQETHRYGDDLAKLAATPGVDLQIRIKAAQTLGSVRPGPTQVSEMANLARDLGEAPEIRRAAVSVIRPEDAAVQGVAETLCRILAEPKQDAEVRGQAAQTLAQVKPLPAGVVSGFITIVGNPNTEIDLRRSVAYAAGMAGPGAAEVVPTLARVLDESPDLMLRRQACLALTMIRHNGEGAESAVERIVRDDDADSELRRTAVSALGAIGADDKTIDSRVVPVLLNILTNSGDSQMRRNASSYLGQMEVGGTQTVSVLRQIVSDANEDPQLRISAVGALETIGRGNNIDQALPVLIEVWQNEQEQRGIRQAIARAFMQAQPRPQEAISALIKVMQESADPQMRATAANSLGVVGERSKPAAAALAAILSDKKQGTSVRATAAQALGRTGVVAKPYLHSLLAVFSEEEISYSALQGFESYGEQAEADGDIGSIAILKEAEAAATAKPALANMEGRDGVKYVVLLQRSVEALQRQSSAQRERPLSNVWSALMRHRILSLSLVLPASWLVWLGICGILLIVWPARLLPISNLASRAAGQFVEQGGFRIPLGWLILPELMRFHPKCLDAWVTQKVPAVRAKFARLPTVQQREIYVDLPVQIDDHTEPHFSPESLRTPFNNPRTLILVIGEGGAGKTSVACQIGKWMLEDAGALRLCDHLALPVLIEGDVAAQAMSGGDPFQETIRGQLPYLLDEKDPPSKSMLESLLKHKRVVVIVDGFSEMSEASRVAIRPIDPTFPAHALLVTSRDEEPSLGANRTTIRPERLERSSLGNFIEAYLERRNKDELIDLVQFQDYAASLQRLVGERGVTPLFAKLYIDLIVSSKEGNSGEPLPKTVPELVLKYLHLLNRGIVSGRKEDYDVHRLAKVVASECVMPNFRPAPARIPAVLSALGDGQEAREELSYLEDRLRLTQTVQFGSEVRFTLDPLAEYLAALQLVEQNETDDGKWRDFLSDVDGTDGSPSTIRGFLEAVTDCFQYGHPEMAADGFIVREIRTRLNIA